jgi:CheY-like chemotaxis protein
MSLKLFVADDSVTIQKIVSLAFSGEDVVIEAVSDGDSALEALQRFRPDVVLADVFMPGCNGYEVCARIKEDPELKDVPVILLVGTFEPFDESEASRVKSDACLTKPFDTSELIQTVQRLAGEKFGSSAAASEPKEPSGKAPVPFAGKFVSRAAVDSFLGEHRILELFDPGVPSADIPVSAALPETPVSGPVLSEATLDHIVEKVVRRMSPEVIREVAWEVVPELSETIIRGTLKEQPK